MGNTEDILNTLRQSGDYRKLNTVTPQGKYLYEGGCKYLNMSSNDYLGLSADTALQREFSDSIRNHGRFIMGNPASRLMTGNNIYYDNLENTIGGMFGGRSCLVLGSGYAVNTGVLPAITSKNDIILADKFVHASIIDGLRLCGCKWARFVHNDMEHLETLLRKARENTGDGNIWIVTESVFSMDGDKAPLSDIARLKERYGARLYIDEAHAFGVFGDNGQGLAYATGILSDDDILIATLGKAAASAGAFVVCGRQTRELLVNRMRPLIFSTALPPVNLMWSQFVVERMSSFEDRRKHLAGLIKTASPENPEATQIVPVTFPGSVQALEAAGKLRKAGFWATAIRYPTVPKGSERLRISLNASMAEEDIIKFMEYAGALDK